MNVPTAYVSLGILMALVLFLYGYFAYAVVVAYRGRRR